MVTSESTLESYQNCRKQVHRLRFARRIALVGTLAAAGGTMAHAIADERVPGELVPFSELDSLWEEATLAGAVIAGIIGFGLHKAQKKKKEARDTWVDVWHRCSTR